MKKLHLAAILFTLSSLLFTSSATPVQTYGQLQVQGNKILDKNGSPVQLRGMSFFWSQWMEQYWNGNVVGWLASDWKATVVRAAMGVETSNPEDPAYLSDSAANSNRVRTVVNAAIANGLYVIIDWHDHNATNHEAKAKAFFEEMARTYGNYPNVIYEIFNEPLQVPWSGVKAYSERIIDAIRAIDPDNLIIVGTPSWCQDVDIAANDPITGKSNIAYSLHFYAASHKATLRSKASSALSKGVALFVSEFGTCENTGSGTLDTNETKTWFSFMDQNKLSWCNWSIADKAETASALVGGASSSGGWSESSLTTSGKFIRRYLREYSTEVTVPPTRYDIPGTIQAENFSNMSGVQTETTLDAGGGENVGYIDNGDWMEYLINVQSTGNYRVDVRAATLNSGTITFKVDGADAGTLNVPTTGDWQNWQTFNTTLSLSQGNHTLRLAFSGAADGLLNLNWLNFASSTSNQAPSVSVSSPANNASFTAPASVSITAAASDADGSVSKVEFFNGTTKLGEDNSSPYNYNWTNVAAGTYTITAKATDNSGAVTTSTAVSITVSNPNQAPSVSISSPVNNATFTAPASITITAAASDADGSVSKVEFFNGTTKLGEDNSSPYNYNWTNVAAGTYTITAKATDNSGAVTTSAAVSIIVSNPNQAPSVSISSPVNNATFTAPASVTFTAAASDADGSVSKVEFFNGTTKLGEDNSSPYNYNWTNVPAGTYTITAKATDNSGAVTTSASVSITVSNPNQAPSVSISSPVNNATFTAPASITITAAASDADGSVSKVEFFNGTTKLGEDNSSPYNYNWTNVAAGTYTITAKATDNSEAVTTSAAVSITISNPNQAPSVSISSPVNNATFTAPASITITAAASDADGSVSKVEFFNGTTKLGEDNSSPYNYNWTNVTAGTYSITAKATDNSGAVTTSTAVIITIGNLNQAPFVTITRPENDEEFVGPANIPISADASDADGSVIKVEFFSGTVKLGEASSSPYTFNWTNVPFGSYVLTAKATDDSGAVTTSDPVSFKVNDPNHLPIVAITSPSYNEEFTAPATVAINANASDDDGTIARVEFYNGAEKLGEVQNSPYIFNWQNVAEGNYVITAKAIDDKGAMTISSAVVIKVLKANLAPAILITSPSTGTIFSAPAEITITTDARDQDGTVQKVEFFNGNTKIGEETQAPFTFVWTDVPAGSYALGVKATDNSGNVTMTTGIDIIVNQLPTVSLTSPAENVTFEYSTPIQLSAEASDEDGQVTKVEFYDGITKIGECTALPFEFIWNDAQIGEHVLTAKVTDNRGATVSSQEIRINVSQLTASRISNKETNRIELRNQSLVLTNAQNVGLQIYDLRGKLVCSRQFSGSHILMLNTLLGDGVYVVEVQTAEKILFRKRINIHN